MAQKTTTTPVTSIVPETGVSDAGAELRPDVLMHRKIKDLENSDLYKNATPPKKQAFQKIFYNKFVTPVNIQNKSNISLFDWTKNRFLLERQAHQSEKDFRDVEGTSLKDPKAFEQPTIDEKLGLGVVSGVESLITAPYNLARRLGPGAAKEYEDAVKSGEVNKSEKELGLDKYLLFKTKGAFSAINKDRETIGTRNFDESLSDQLTKGIGEFVGQYPAFAGASRVIGLLNGVGLDAITNPAVTEKLPFFQKIGARLVHGYADGFLVGAGTGDDPHETGKMFGGMEGVGAIFSPLAKYVGGLIGAGGKKLVSQAIASADKAAAEGAIETKVSPFTIAKVGTPKQKLNAATFKMLNELVQGDWNKASRAERKAAVNKLARMHPELESQMGGLNTQLVHLEAQNNLNKIVKATPEAGELLQKLEKINGQKGGKIVADSVEAHATAREMVKNPSKIKVGAASAKSLEFEDNFSRAVDQHLKKLKLNNVQFEDRGHKLLYYLNVLMTESRRMGPSKERNQMFEMLTRQLNQRYPEATLPQLMAMSDNVWSKIEKLTQAGVMANDEKVRFYRQSEVRPGEAPFAHEFKLVEQAKAMEKLENENKVAFTEDRGKPEKAPQQKDRRSTIRVSLDDPDTLRDIIDMHDVKISKLAKELHAKDITPGESKEIKDAIEREMRMKQEAKTKIQSLADAKKKAAREAKVDNKNKDEGDNFKRAIRLLFPGKAYLELTTDERSEVSRKSNELSGKPIFDKSDVGNTERFKKKKKD